MWLSFHLYTTAIHIRGLAARKQTLVALLGGMGTIVPIYDRQNSKLLLLGFGRSKCVTGRNHSEEKRNPMLDIHPIEAKSDTQLQVPPKYHVGNQEPEIF
jgi:hypothetical protein